MLVHSRFADGQHSSEALAFPQNLSGLAIETDHKQGVIIMRGDKDPIARQHW